MDRARCPPAQLPRTHGRRLGGFVRGLGPPRQGRPRHRRLQRLGPAVAPHARARRVGRLGAVPPGRARGHELPVRDPGCRRHRPPQERPHGPHDGGGPQAGRHRHRDAPHLARRRLDGAAQERRRPHRADEHLRGAPRVLASGPRLPGTGRAPRQLRAGRRIHPRRVPPGHGAPVRPVLGVPRHRLLRAELAVGDSRRLPVPRRRAPPGRRRGDPRLGPRTLRHG